MSNNTSRSPIIRARNLTPYKNQYDSTTDRNRNYLKGYHIQDIRQV